jgi:hypothetical protein
VVEQNSPNHNESDGTNPRSVQERVWSERTPVDTGRILRGENGA